MPTRIYIVEDHRLMRQVVSEVIEKMPGFSICGMAASGEEALEELETVEADVALIDMSLPQMSGVELVRLLQKKQPALRCLIFSGHREESYVDAALAAGAYGYLIKGRPSEIKKAVNDVVAGKQYVSEELRPAHHPNNNQ